MYFIRKKLKDARENLKSNRIGKSFHYLIISLIFL